MARPTTVVPLHEYEHEGRRVKLVSSTGNRLYLSAYVGSDRPVHRQVPRAAASWRTWAVETLNVKEEQVDDALIARLEEAAGASIARAKPRARTATQHSPPSRLGRRWCLVGSSR